MNAPSGAVLEGMHFMHKAAYTHVIIQQQAESEQDTN